MLSADGLQKSFKARMVVRDFAFSIREGEVVGLLGPNGAGKTTCFYMIVGLIEADAGSIRLDKQDITGLPMHARAKLGIGYLPQEASVFRRLSVADNIMAVLELRAGLTELPSVKVMPPRVAESPIHFECELVHHYALENHSNGGAVLLVGRIVLFHFKEELIDEKYHIDMGLYRPVARLAGAHYSTLGDIFSVKRNV